MNGNTVGIPKIRLAMAAAEADRNAFGKREKADAAEEVPKILNTANFLLRSGKMTEKNKIIVRNENTRSTVVLH